MIIDVHKLEPIDNIKVDLNDTTFIYFLFAIDEHTPRYSRVDGGYVHNPYGSIIMDHGFDVFHRNTRVLLYIGETSTGIRRINDHWISVNHKKGVGPIFTHMRRIRNPRFMYDSVRLHYERVLVRKYLPKINKNANFTEKQLTILRNSKGKIKPQDITRPYLLNYNDIFEAYLAWDNEDESYLTHVLGIQPTYNKLGFLVERRYMEGYYRDNKKMPFGRFITDVVLHLHKKMKEASADFNKNIRAITKIFNIQAYEDKLEKDKMFNKKRYKNNKKELIAKSNEWRRLRNAEKKKKSNSKGIETQP